MPTRGTHEGIEHAAAPSLDVRGDGAAIGYDPRRTLPVIVEIKRQWTRRRTRFTLGFLIVLPFLLVAAFKLGGHQPSNGAPGLVQLATTGAANFTLFVLFASTGFLLVVVFALFAGDAVASEASWASLRYLLAAPVPRSHLLRRKLVVALLFSVVALFVLPVTSYLAGGLFFGWAAARTPLGVSLSVTDSLVRLGIVVGYLAVTQLFVAALSFMLGVWTDAPLGAVGGAVLLVIVSNILDAVTALGSWRQVLPTHYQFAWSDALGEKVVWDNMARGVLWSLGFTLVLLTLAWWHFDRKDVVS